MYVNKQHLIDLMTLQLNELEYNGSTDEGYDALEKIRHLIVRGDYDVEPIDTVPMGNIDLENIQVAVRQLDRYLAMNQRVREEMMNQLPSSASERSDLSDLKAFMSSIGNAMVRMLNAHFLHISREVYCICDIEYVGTNYGRSEEYEVSLHNGVDSDCIVVECGNDHYGDGLFFSRQQWRHFSDHHDKYVYLRWHENGFNQRFCKIAEAWETSEYWGGRDIAAEVAVAQKCRDLYRMHQKEGIKTFCPYCGVTRYPHHDRGNVLIGYCNLCHRPHLIECNMDAFGINPETETMPERMKNTRWDLLEIDGL